MWYNVNRNGQLGNRLFSRAHVYAAAMEFGETVVDWGLLDAAKYYPNVAKYRLPVYPLLDNGSVPPLPDGLLTREPILSAIHKLRPRMTGTLWRFWNYHWNTGNSEAMRLDSDRFRDFKARYPTLVLNGFKLRCPEWVAKHRESICDYFRPDSTVIERCAGRMSELRNEYARVTGLHIRATDFRTAAGGRFFLSPQEYAEIIRDRTDFDAQNDLVLIFSDEAFAGTDSQGALRDIFDGLNVLCNGGSVIEDLVTMSMCDRIIGPANSTYSRWSAFTGNLMWAGVGRTTLCDDKPLEFKPCPVPWDYKLDANGD